MGSRRKRAYFIVILLGAAALAADRLLLQDSTTGPDVAVAGSDVVRSTSGPSVDHAIRPAPIPELPFPTGLEPFALRGTDETIRDLFSAPGVRAAGDATGTNPSHSRGTDGENRLSGSAFRTRHQLGGVVIHRRLRIAVVDDLWVKKGQSLDGCELVDIAGNEARFECHDETVVLEVLDTGMPKKD